MFQDWWIWAGAAVVLGILELFAPGYVFLGFAGGALTLGVAGAWAPELLSSWSTELMVFALASALCWAGLRWFSMARRDEPRIWYGDIKDD